MRPTLAFLIVTLLAAVYVSLGLAPVRGPSSDARPTPVSAHRVTIAAPQEARLLYTAQDVRTIDGDTYVLALDLGFDLTATVHVRLLGIDTPELRTPTGPAARTFADDALRRGEPLVECTGKQTFARWLCDVFVDRDHDGRYAALAELLRQAGHIKETP